MAIRILEGLAAKNHTIDLYTSFSQSKPIKGINHFQIPGVKDLDKPNKVLDLRKIPPVGFITLMFEAPTHGNDQCRNSLNSKNEVMTKLRDTKKHYDLILSEVFVVDCFFGFAHVVKAPIVSLTSSVNLPWGTHRIGNPDNPAYIPNYYADFGEDMTLYERIVNTFTLMYAKYKHRSYIAIQQEIAKDFFGDDLPSLDDIVASTSLFLLNSHFSLNQARPNVPNVIEVAGAHIPEPKQLTKEFLDIIGDSKFIYFSFGSLVNSETITLEKLQHICDAFKELKYPVLWKAERKDLPKELIIPKNVHTKPWMPQLDILCHPNILFFITHSGLMGTEEAVYCGVPMLSIPLFADQFLNSKKVTKKGIALSLEIEEASKEEVYNSMKELIENPKYKRNVKKVSEEFNDRPRKPLDEAVYWIEYVLRHRGAPQLRSKSADLTWYQYYLVDVGLVILSVIAIMLSILYKTIKYVSKHLLKRVRYSDKKTQ